MPTGMKRDYEVGYGKPRGMPVSRRASPATREAAGRFNKPGDFAEERLWNTNIERSSPVPPSCQLAQALRRAVAVGSLGSGG